MLADARVAVAGLDPGESLWSVRLRRPAISGVLDGVPGAWVPLATLVRLPRLASLECPDTPMWRVACPGLTCS